MNSLLHPFNLESPAILGVLNLTPDSFSDGGLYLDTDAAVRHALHMVHDGAAMLDLGAESTRPGSRGVSDTIQKQRLLPVLKRLRNERTLKHVPFSIDTQSSEVFHACLSEGANFLNDISALRADKKLAKICARSKCPVILMHMLGTPKTMQKSPTYTNVIAEIAQFFKQRIHFALDAGINANQILLDPGIGFGKTTAHNLEILRRISEFKSLGHPLVVGVSRKRFLGEIAGIKDPAKRVIPSIAAGVVALQNGASILRVHDVAEHARALKIVRALQPHPNKP